jgi:excisionase family DNA binding protein
MSRYVTLRDALQRSVCVLYIEAGPLYGLGGSPDVDEVLTAEEVAAYLRIHLITVRRWCRQGELPAAKVGRSYRIRRMDLDRWWAARMEGNQTGANAPEQQEPGRDADGGHTA